MRFSLGEYMGQDNQGNFFAFFLGGLLGAGVALLFAPKAGKETREKLREYAKDIEGRLKNQVDDVKEYTTKEVHKIKEKAHNAVEEGKRAFKEEMKKNENVDET